MGKGGKTQSYYLVWSVLFKSAQGARNAINEWNASHPKATIYAMDSIMGQIRVPTALPSVSQEELLEMAEKVDCAESLAVVRVSARPI